MSATKSGCSTIHRALYGCCLALSLAVGVAGPARVEAAPPPARARPAPPPAGPSRSPPLPAPSPPAAAPPSSPADAATPEADEPPVDELTGRFRDLEQRIEQTREMIVGRRPTVTLGGYVDFG